MNFITGVLLKTLLEVITGKIMSLGWRVLAERLVTRILVWALVKLREMSTNEVVDGTVTDILAQLKGKKLPEATLGT